MKELNFSIDSHQHLPQQEKLDGRISEKETELKTRIKACWPHDLDAALDIALQLYRLRLKRGQEHGGCLLPVQQIKTLAFYAVDGLEKNTNFDEQLQDEHVVMAVVNWLESEIHRYQWRDTDLAVRYAEAILKIGEQGENQRVIAIGKMAYGDSIRRLGMHFEDASGYLKEAAALFLSEGDLVGWGRTCTGRLAVCSKSEVVEVLSNVELARTIFARFGRFILHIRLTVNVMNQLYEMGHYQEVIELYHQTIPIVTRCGEEGTQYLGYLYNNVGLAHLFRGELHQAQSYFQSAEKEFQKHQKPETFQVVPLNLAYIQLAQGNYSKALEMFHRLLNNVANQNSTYGLDVKMYMAESYLHLNRYSEVIAITGEIDSNIDQQPDELHNHLAQTWCHRAVAETQLGKFYSAENNLRQAQEIFEALKSVAWTQFVNLLLAELAALQQRYEESLQLSIDLVCFYEQQGQLIHLMRTLLVKAKSHLALGEIEDSRLSAQKVAKLARQLRSPIFRYHAHALLGKIQTEYYKRPHQSKRHLTVALGVIRRLESYLTATYRADFLDDKLEPLHAFIALCLADNEPRQAMNALEQVKSIPFFNSLRRNRRDRKRLDADAMRVFEQFTAARERHHVLYQQVHDPASVKPAQDRQSIEIVSQQLVEVELQLKQLGEQLYLFTGDVTWDRSAELPDVPAIQARLQSNQVMFAFYVGDKKIWVFVIEPDAITVVPLPDETIVQLPSLLDRLQDNIDFALSAKAEANDLIWTAQGLGKKLFHYLFDVLEPWLARYDKLIIVPYGNVHYVPFNILRRANRYLFETHELVVLPAAGLIARQSQQRPSGALVLAHSYDGHIPHVHREADMVAEIFQSTVCMEHNCKRDHLNAPPVQILHVAAHGKQRFDRAELSFIHLADGQMFADDLLQHDLSYELVVLSGCETGRAVVHSSEELIGLSRGVLNAGAGALLSSMWRVEDESTAELMALFYEQLAKGSSKSAALQKAQQTLIDQDHELHPAFWGAFQLVGDSRPLSKGVTI